jgi:hypothetical protein
MVPKVRFWNPPKLGDIIACFCASMILLFVVSCSQHEYSMDGPAPPAPKNAREAHLVKRGESGGMNQVAEPEAEVQESPAGRSFTGTVVLPPELAKRVKPGEVLFVIARSTDGSPTPVAAEKLVANSFPLAFQLTDANAMMGGALPDQADILIRLDADGDLSTHGPDDMVAGPERASSGVPITLTLQEPK